MKGRCRHGYLRRTLKCSCSCSSVLMYVIFGGAVICALSCARLCVCETFIIDNFLYIIAQKRTVWKVFERKETFSMNKFMCGWCYCCNACLFNTVDILKTDLQANGLKFMCNAFEEFVALLFSGIQNKGKRICYNYFHYKHLVCSLWVSFLLRFAVDGNY